MKDNFYLLSTHSQVGRVECILIANNIVCWYNMFIKEVTLVNMNIYICGLYYLSKVNLLITTRELTYLILSDLDASYEALEYISYVVTLLAAPQFYFSMRGIILVNPISVFLNSLPLYLQPNFIATYSLVQASLLCLEPTVWFNIYFE